MNETHPQIQLIQCQVVEIQYQFACLPCDVCQHPAAAVDQAEREAIDLDLDHPILLHITVSVHFCPHCQHYFRAQPPFLRPDAIYTNRVVTKAVLSVFEDRMARRRVTDRLARDFWVRPSEASVRRWCKVYQSGFHFETDYQIWAVRGFSGILCVDEVYQNGLVLFLAVDPAAPGGDRLIGYQLLKETVDAAQMETFLSHLRELGISPEQVITDGSSLYPAVLKKVWPLAAHQLCLFHETRHVTKAVMEAIQELRKSLPTPPPADRQGRGGPLRDHPPSEDPNDPAFQRWHQRRQERHSGMAQVQQLHKAGLSQRAIARQMGLHRRTVQKWLLEEVPGTQPPIESKPQPMVPTTEQKREVPKPSAPWQDWEEIHQVREALQEYRFLFVKHPNHLTKEEKEHVELLLQCPIGTKLQILYAFMKDWYSIWRNTEGNRASWSEALLRYQAWRSYAAYHDNKPLHRILERIHPDRFERISQFMKNERWEATNNGAERTGREFRHQQAPHYNLRTEETIEGLITVNAIERMRRSTSPRIEITGYTTRGRNPVIRG